MVTENPPPPAPAFWETQYLHATLLSSQQLAAPCLLNLGAWLIRKKRNGDIDFSEAVLQAEGQRFGLFIFLYSEPGMSRLLKLFHSEEISKRESVKWSNRPDQPSGQISAKGIRKEGRFGPRTQSNLSSEAGVTRVAEQGYIPLCCYGDRNDLWRVCESLESGFYSL